MNNFASGGMKKSHPCTTGPWTEVRPQVDSLSSIRGKAWPKGQAECAAPNSPCWLEENRACQRSVCSVPVLADTRAQPVVDGRQSVGEAREKHDKT